MSELQEHENGDQMQQDNFEMNGQDADFDNHQNGNEQHARDDDR